MEDEATLVIISCSIVSFSSQQSLIEDLRNLTFQHLTGEEVKRIYEVSTLWNEIASASKKCGDKLRLRIYDIDDHYNHDKLQAILKNKRKYGTLWFNSRSSYDVYNTRLLQQIVAGLGSSLKELTINGSIKTSLVAVLLRPLRNLKELYVSSMVDDEPAGGLSPLQLPKLRKLHLYDPNNLWLDLFANVSSLEEFEVCSEKALSSCHAFEDFVLRQEKLKKLSIESDHPSWGNHQMFSDVSRVKFRLETIFIDGLCISKDNAVKFFQQQQQVKTVSIGNFIEPSQAEYLEILRSIWTLPKLESFRFIDEVHITDQGLVTLSDIRNESVKEIHFHEVEEAEFDGRMFEIFPNLETYDIASNNLKLINVPSEKLKTIKSECTPNDDESYRLVDLVYQPPLAVFNQERFESEVIEFIRRFYYVYSLDIGRSEWIQQGIKLSIDFWRKVLPKLNWIVIRHSGDIKELVQLLIYSERNITAVEIRTDAVGRASVEEMELPSWLELTDIDW
jgi:hypothetical protein